jgi:hypothetical protein
LIAVLDEAFARLGAVVDAQASERIAVMVHRVMSFQSRQFHTLDHVFGFLEGADPETVLAAVFHDLVYYQVDDGLPPELETLIAARIGREGEDLRLGSLDEPDSAFSDCLSVFGYSAGQRLAPTAGLNELLSALVMAETLGPLVSRRVILEVAVAIEATIPFRGPDDEGRGVGEVLYARLASLPSGPFGGMKKDEVRASIERAIAFSNRDVKDFAMTDPGQFLSNTWKLLPESNASLRRRGAYSIREYRIALQKMLGFFKSLDPGKIFHQFGGKPGEEELAVMEGRARKNLECASQYLEAKLLAVGLLEALAIESGGDAPMALFMGDLPPEGSTASSLVDHLPPAVRPAWLDESSAVYLLLRDGRLDDSSFDLKNSPLALYLYRRLEPEALQERIRALEAFFAGKLGARPLLSGFGSDLLADIVEGGAAMVPGRAAALRRLLA